MAELSGDLLHIANTSLCFSFFLHYGIARAKDNVCQHCCLICFSLMFKNYWENFIQKSPSHKQLSNLPSTCQLF